MIGIQNIREGEWRTTEQWATMLNVAEDRVIETVIDNTPQGTLRLVTLEEYLRDRAKEVKRGR